VSSRHNRPEGRPPFIEYRKAQRPTRNRSILHCEKVSFAAMAERFGTPLYIYSAAMIRSRMQAFDRAFRGVPHTVCYSVKANSNLSLLRLLAMMGCGFDVVSGGELERVLSASRPSAKKVVFSGVGKTRDEMRAALRAGILLFNVESDGELLALAECAAQAKKIARIALRVNPDVPAKTHPYISTGLHQHKFGFPIHQASRLYAEAAANRHLRVAGVSVHIGSQITDVRPFSAAMKRVAALVQQLRGQGHRIEYVDAGGGLGIAYEQANAVSLSKQASKYAEALLLPLRELKVHLLLEPGRCIVGPAGVLVTRVLCRKKNDGKRFVVVDAAMNDLLRPSLYGAYHEIIPVISSSDTGLEKVDVVGPVCESGDFLARDRAMPTVQEGDLLAVLDTGAYGMVLASNYNTRPRPAEVLVDKKSVKAIRSRETTADLFRMEL